jgi:hypothetical protein
VGELNFNSSNGYWRESRQPIYTAVLILPFLLVYEIGIILLRSEFINGGDAIVRTLFGRIFGLMGFNVSFISALVLMVCLLVWQFRQKGSWKLNPPVLIALFFESLLYAVILFMLLYNIVQYLPASTVRESQASASRTESKARSSPSQPNQPHKAQAARTRASESSPRISRKPSLQDFVLYCGAGVYEELVFRVGLLGLLLLVFTKLFHMEHAYAAAWAVVVGAAIFSAFHHIGGEPFTIAAFLQRFFAGVYFAAIYYNRSFGVAAASHALFDMIVGLNNLRIP